MDKYGKDQDSHKASVAEMHMKSHQKFRGDSVKSATKAYQAGKMDEGDRHGEAAVRSGKAAKFWRRRMERYKK